MITIFKNLKIPSFSFIFLLNSINNVLTSDPDTFIDAKVAITLAGDKDKVTIFKPENREIAYMFSKVTALSDIDTGVSIDQIKYVVAEEQASTTAEVFGQVDFATCDLYIFHINEYEEYLPFENDSVTSAATLESELETWNSSRVGSTVEKVKVTLSLKVGFSLETTTPTSLPVFNSFADLSFAVEYRLDKLNIFEYTGITGSTTTDNSTDNTDDDSNDASNYTYNGLAVNVDIKNIIQYYNIDGTLKPANPSTEIAIAFEVDDNKFKDIISTLNVVE